MRRWYLITSLFLLACSSGCKTSVTPVGSGTAEPRRNAQAPQSSSDIASTDWRITGFVTQCDGDDYEFANVDRDHPPDHSINNQPVSSRLAMVLEQPISTGEAMAFETKDDPEQTNGFQGLLGTECDTPTPVKAAGAPNKDQLGDFFHLHSGWVFFWGYRPGGRTKLVRAYASHTDYSMRIIPASGPDPERHQIRLYSTDPLHTVNVWCRVLPTTLTSPPDKQLTPANPFLEISSSGSGCTYSLTPSPSTQETSFQDCVQNRRAAVP